MIVRLEEIKAHLRVQQDDEDVYLTGLIAMAQSAAEDFCKTTFAEAAPESVRLAVLLFVGHYYEFRDSSDKHAYLAMRMAFEALLWPHRDLSKLF